MWAYNNSEMGEGWMPLSSEAHKEYLAKSKEREGQSYKLFITRKTGPALQVIMSMLSVD